MAMSVGYDTEQSLIEGLQRKQPQAYEALLRDHGPRLLALAKRICRDDAQAQDAMQDAMIQVFRSIDRFDGRSQLSTWLYRVTVNASLMRLRKAKRLSEQSVDDLLPTFSWIGHRHGHGGAWRAGPADQAQREEMRQIVREAIAQLPETHRDVLLLRDIQQLSTEESAEQLGINVGAVKTRLHRARQALRELLDPHMRDEESS